MMWSANAPMIFGSEPKPFSGLNASPLIFSTYLFFTAVLSFDLTVDH